MRLLIAASARLGRGALVLVLLGAGGGAVAAGLPLSLTAARAPVQQGWTEPARFALVNNARGEDYYAIDMALSADLPAVAMFDGVYQGQLSLWLARNSLLQREQNKFGLDYIGPYVVPHHNLVLEAGLEKDEVLAQSGVLLQLYDQLSYLPWRLGGCGTRLDAGCTFWNAALGTYAQAITDSPGAGEGTVAGIRAQLQLISTPFAVSSPFNPLDMELTAQWQNDVSASQRRSREHRRLLTASLVWNFYKTNERPLYQPAIAVEWVDGEDLFTGQPDQRYTQISLLLRF